LANALTVIGAVLMLAAMLWLWSRDVGVPAVVLFLALACIVGLVSSRFPAR
jgi:NhaP-type Na+/H+ and K+/H+ antiporter